ncbi:ATP-grasp domain-containing protein [Streptomyces sp. CSDS2]|uniref:ATP-grasp domain-containing protein n=1 Tax=Streptomyces sp. CSDS2 TaxID=3055051 RepID=UPI0025B01EA6|nr:ATP-grasp domain-containing protein [Streptomyces sp. CSDS2]MDN3261189.1 ATP-grasp domain-containing protein [Streptomyces sp. CSDS2]
MRTQSEGTAGVLAIVETGLHRFGAVAFHAARELGLDTVFLTRDMELYAHAPAVLEAVRDARAIVFTDTSDPDRVVEELHRLQEGADLRGVFSSTDYSVAVAAAAARALGLPGLDPQAALNARNKRRTRELCAKAGVPVPRWTVALTEREALSAAREFGLPCIVKPMTEAGSLGVRLCRSEAALLAAFHAIADVPTDFRGQPREPGALVEEYLVGPEVSVESLTWGGETVVLGVTDKMLGPHPYFVELGETFPSLLPPALTEQCAAVARAALEALGHDFGAAHVEVKLTADGPRLIEVNARMGGAQITRLVAESTGLNMPREIIRMHTGGTPDLSFRTSAAAVSRYVTAPAAGRIEALHGVDLARRVPGVIEVEIDAVPGDEARVPTDNVDVVGHLVAKAPTPGEAVRLADTALGQITMAITPPSAP